MRSPGLLVVLIAVLAIGGCSWITGEQEGDQGQEQGQTEATSSEALVQGPADRDPAAVVGSLLSLDPCKLRRPELDDRRGVQEALAADAPEPGRLNGPLTYGPDEPDSGAPGACVDFPDVGCQPYQQVEPPAGADVVKAAAANPDLLCAVAIGPVREILGAEFQPVTYGEFCAFVEPTHQLTVFLSALPDEVPDNSGGNPELYQDRQTIDVAGHPAVAFTSGDPQMAWTIPSTRRPVQTSPPRASSAPSSVSVRPGAHRANDEADLKPSRSRPWPGSGCARVALPTAVSFPCRRSGLR
jgi:hypothetical protein